MDQKHIDSLLERYLTLLDEYTQLRDRLSHLQSGVYQGIARANFSAERGLRYGRDQYDDRMQASRLLRIRSAEVAREAYSFTMFDPTKEEVNEAEEDDKNDKGGTEGGEDGSADEGSEDKQKDGPEQEERKKKTDEEKDEEEKKKTASAHANNPLRWFGILAPMPLRNAQSLSVEVVEEVIPRLATVNDAMYDLEIEVRRARKKRAKEAKAAEKTKTLASASATEDAASGSGLAKPVEAS